MSDDNIKKFVNRNNMQVIDDKKRAYKHTRMDVKYFNNFSEYYDLTSSDSIL